MNLGITQQDEGVTIHLIDKFDFSNADAFQAAYEKNPSENYTIDFGDIQYMDSSGLGMLLNMRRKTKPAQISLVNCNPQIKRILVLSRFEEQFSIS